MQTVKIDTIEVGPQCPPVIIAEMSGNHNHSLERALAIVEAAASAGVQAIKLQTYTADTLTMDGQRKEFFIHDPNSLWYGRSLYQLYQQAYTPWEWHKPILDRCRKLGLLAFSTPFDASAVDFLTELDVPCFKIASFEIIDLPLIQKAAATGKPLILSTGMATLAEIDEAVTTAREAGAEKIILLKCTSTYPANPEDSNLLTIPNLSENFSCPVGLSDHTPGIGTAIAGIALGGCMIEKHFTLSRADGGVDAAFSLEPAEMKILVEQSRQAWLSLGQCHYGPTEAEKKSLLHRRSLYVVKDIKCGEVFSSQNVKSIRPGLGLQPKYYPIVLGKRANCDIEAGTPLNWDFFSGSAI